MAETLNFTKASLDALPLPAKGKVAEYKDAQVPGLIVRVSPTGGMTFYLYQWTRVGKAPGQAKRHLVGRYPGMTIPAARQKARELAGQVASGEDPSAAPVIDAADALTVGQLFDWWDRNHTARKKSGWRDREQYNLHLAHLGARRAASITRTDVRGLHNTLGARAPVAANRVLALVRAVYNRAIADEILTCNNPALGIKPFEEEARERRLTQEEADALLTAILSCNSVQLADFVQLLMFTGQRKTNVLAMAWEDVNLDTGIWRIPGGKTKSSKPILVPLLEAELAILKRRQRMTQGPWVFPGRSDGALGHLVEPKNGWKALLVAAKIDDFHIHDLRRSLASFMVDTGASLEVIGKTLGHRSQAATAIYARLSLEPVKEAKALALASMQASLS